MKEQSQFIIIGIVLLTCFQFGECQTETHSQIAAFRSRKQPVDWEIEWVIKPDDVKRCKANPQNCCFDEGRITPFTDFNGVIFTGPASGNCFYKNRLMITIRGDSPIDLNEYSSNEPTGLIYINDNTQSILRPNHIGITTLISIDNSSEYPASFGLRLPSIHSKYDLETALNYIWLISL